MVQLRSLYVLETHANGDQFIPCGECFGLEEVGGVVGREGLVDSERCDFGGDCIVSVGETGIGCVRIYCVVPSQSCHRQLLFRLSWLLVSTSNP